MGNRLWGWVDGGAGLREGLALGKGLGLLVGEGGRGRRVVAVVVTVGVGAWRGGLGARCSLLCGERGAGVG